MSSWALVVEGSLRIVARFLDNLKLFALQRQAACANPFVALGVRHGGQCLLLVTVTNGTNVRGAQSNHLAQG